MYCPRCATQNLDAAKFCRACGTDLESVALALADRHLPAELPKQKPEEGEAAKSWLRKRSQGASNTVQGTILLGTALLIGVALGLFSNQPDWMIIWLIFVGWMACWGAISLTIGIGAILESKIMSLEREEIGGRTTETAQLLSADDMEIDRPRQSAPLRVTEHTTEPLSKEQPRSKEAS